MLHAALDLAPHGVLAVEEAGVVEDDEELAVGAVRIRRAGHRAHPAHVRLVAEFGLEVGQLGPARAGARRVAALGHEAGNYAVECDAVVKAAVGQLGDPRDVTGREVWAKLDDDVAASRKGEGESVGVGHGYAPELRGISAPFKSRHWVAPEQARQ